MLESLGVSLSLNPWSFYFSGTKLGSHNQQRKPVAQVLLFSLIYSKQHKHSKAELNINHNYLTSCKDKVFYVRPGVFPQL